MGGKIWEDASGFFYMMSSYVGILLENAGNSEGHFTMLSFPSLLAQGKASPCIGNCAALKTLGTSTQFCGSATLLINLGGRRRRVTLGPAVQNFELRHRHPIQGVTVHEFDQRVNYGLGSASTRRLLRGG